MRARPTALAARLLPHGWGDLLRQFALVAVAYSLYRLVRGLVEGRAADAYHNARSLIELERSLDLFVEPAVHAWASSERWLIDAASWIYVNSHLTLTLGTLVFVYVRRNGSFYFGRNMAFPLIIGLAIARMVRRPWARGLWTIYPAVVTFVVAATANHRWMDAFLGALTAAVSAWSAQALLARARPALWAWNPRTGVAA